MEDMKANPFTRETLTEDFLKEWQNLIDTTAEILGVVAGLITRVDGNQIEILLSSESKGNPYTAGYTTHYPDSGWFCERTLKSRNLNLIPNALEDPDWKDNAAVVGFNIISYVGMPILRPDGGEFGTICFLDNKSNPHNDLHIKILNQVKRMIELSLRVIYDKEVIERQKFLIIESERRLADIIDFLPDATFAIDLSGKVIAWNRAIEEKTGVKAEDILGKGNYEYALPFYGMRRPILIDLALGFDEEIEKKYDLVERKGDVLLAETDVTLKGEPRTLWGKAGPLYDSNGNVAGAIESVRDITELRQARVTLQKSHDELESGVRERTVELMQANKALEAEISERKRAEEKIVILADLSDISPLSITVYDLQDNLLYANQRTFDMHGYSQKEFLARNLKEIDVPSSAAWIEERKKEVLETGEARFIVEHYRKDGTCFPLEVYLKATKWRGQTVLLSVAADITERQRVEEELRKYREKLEIMVTERTRELEEKTNNLQEVNTALNVLLQKREEDKKILEERFVANIGSLVLPYLEKIRKYNLDAQQQFCLDTVENNLDEIVSPLLKNIQQFNLTPREIQIASLINDGKTTKEIAQALGIAEGSISTHRKNIRKKLGLDRASNLQSHLRFFEK